MSRSRTRKKLFSIKTGAVAALVAVAVGLVIGCDNPGSSDGSSFTDSRDGQKYRTVKIGDRTWMAENLNYVTDNSWCYGDADSNCVKYGRLYTLNVADSVCPSGWHLPPDKEWKDLIEVAGGTMFGGKELKSKTGWNVSPGISSTDVFGFSALPGGCRYDGNFSRVGNKGYWWTASVGLNSGAWYRSMDYDGNSVPTGNFPGGTGLSVRCVQDVRP